MTIDRKITKEAALENLGELREFVEESCDKADVPLNVKFDLVLAVDEVCTNVVQHGYKDKKEGGPISIQFQVFDNTVTIIISDKGAPFNPEDAPPPELTPDWKERPVGGLGLFFLKEIADEVAYRTDDEAVNHLKMVKRLTEEDKKDDKADTPKEDTTEDNKDKPDKAKNSAK